MPRPSTPSALAYLNSYRRNLEVLYETPREIPLDVAAAIERPPANRSGNWT